MNVDQDVDGWSEDRLKRERRSLAVVGILIGVGFGIIDRLELRMAELHPSTPYRWLDDGQTPLAAVIWGATILAAITGGLGSIRVAAGLTWIAIVTAAVAAGTRLALVSTEGAGPGLVYVLIPLMAVVAGVGWLFIRRKSNARM